MMYTMPKNLLSICVNFTLATQQKLRSQDYRSADKAPFYAKAAAARQRAFNKLCEVKP